MKILTYADFYNQAGRTETPLMNVNPVATWPLKAWLNNGNRLHGDTLHDAWTSAFSGTDNYATLHSMWWTNIMGWINCIPGANNTTTNALLLVYDFQVQIFSIAQQKWVLVSSKNDRNQRSYRWHHTNTYADEGAADPIFNGRNNIPRFSCVKVAGDRTSAATIPGDELKFKSVHDGLARCVVDPMDVGGVAVLCRARLEPISGSFNGVTEILMQVAADRYPDNTSIEGHELLTGITSMPAIGMSAFSLVPSDGTSRVFCFSTAKIHPDTYIVALDSDYKRANSGTPYAQYMDGTLFAANIPQFLYDFPTSTTVILPDTQTVALGPRTYVRTVPTGTVKYVTPAGAGTHDGSSWANAMTLAEANTAATAGDHYWLADGTYASPANGTRFYNGGSSSSAYVTYEGYAGAAIIDGAAAAVDETMTGIKLQNPFIRLINIEQKNSSMEGIQVTTSDCVVKHCRVHNNKLTGIQVAPGYGYPYSTGRNLIQDCTVYANSDAGTSTGSYANGGNADGIQVPNGKDNIVEYCLSYGNSDDGIDVWRSSVSTVRYCISHSNGIAAGNGNGLKGGATYATYPESYGNIFDHCLTYSNAAMGYDNNGSSGSTINNCTSYGNTGDGFYFESTAIATDNVSGGNGAAKVGTPATDTGNTWNVGGTPSFRSTAEGDANFLKLAVAGGYGNIGCFYP